jgi:hypothetical protein
MPVVIPGLTPAQSDAYREALQAPGARTFARATVLDLDHKPLRQLSPEFDGGLLGGQLRWNRAGDVHTEATFTFSDFDDAIDLDLRHLVRGEMGVRTEDHGVLWCPVITGWVRSCNDTGHESEVTVHDKSAFGLHMSARGSARRGAYVGAVIRRMHRGIGEQHFAIPQNLLEGGPRLAGPVQWGGGKPEKSVTLMSRRLARRHGLQVFYDQLGRLVVRREPRHPSVSWVEHSDRSERLDLDLRLLEPITWARDFTGVRNHVVGRGARVLTAVAVSRDGHVFSPAKLARGGQRLSLQHRFTDDTIGRQGELNAATAATLRRLSREKASVQITSTPAPWLVPMDLLHAAKRDGRATDFWMDEGSMELDGSGMSVGYQQPMRRAARARVRARRKGGRK